MSKQCKLTREWPNTYIRILGISEPLCPVKFGSLSPPVMISPFLPSSVTFRSRSPTFRLLSLISRLFAPTESVGDSPSERALIRESIMFGSDVGTVAFDAGGTGGAAVDAMGAATLGDSGTEPWRNTAEFSL